MGYEMRVKDSFSTPSYVSVEPLRIFSIEENGKKKKIVLGIEHTSVDVYESAGDMLPKKEDIWRYIVAVSDEEKIILGPTQHAESRKDIVFEDNITKRIRAYFGSFQEDIAPYIARKGNALRVYEDIKDIPEPIPYRFEATIYNDPNTILGLNENNFYILFGRLTLKATMDNPADAAWLYELAQGKILREFYLKTHGELNEELMKTMPRPSFEIKKSLVTPNGIFALDYIKENNPKKREIAINSRGKIGFTTRAASPDEPLEKILESMQPA